LRVNGGAGRGDFQDDLAAVARVQVGAGADGIDPVLQQLADEHSWVAVEVVRQQVDHASEVDLETVFHGEALVVSPH
jgi:hypothetical protein